MSLSFEEDGLSSASPRGLCLLVGPTQGQREKKYKHADRLGTCREMYRTHTHTHTQGEHTWKTCLFVSSSGKNAHMQPSSPRDPLGHGRSTVSPLCVVGQSTPRTRLASHTWGSGPWGGGWGGWWVTGTVAVIGRRSGCLLMEPIGREVGATGRAVEGLALEVDGLAATVVDTGAVVKGPEVTPEEFREKRRSS